MSTFENSEEIQKKLTLKDRCEKVVDKCNVEIKKIMDNIIFNERVVNAVRSLNPLKLRDTKISGSQIYEITTGFLFGLIFGIFSLFFKNDM